MAKKAIRLDKVNKHPFSGEIVYLGTKHEKAKALAPHFEKIGMMCETVKIDTDEFGTFTGEVERLGSVKDTLRKKIEAVTKLMPDARFILASEGSFGPHPEIGFIQSDHEILLFFDRLNGLEIFVEELSTDTNHNQMEFEPCDDIQSFLECARFPSHAVIVKTKGSSPKIFKDLTEWHKLGQVIIDAFLLSSEQKVILSTDMRASFNPTRMSVIYKAGEKLVRRLTSFCPSCSMIGFGPVRGIKGLPCSGCGLATQVNKEVLFCCAGCKYEETRPREDGLRFVSPAECDHCNP